MRMVTCVIAPEFEGRLVYDVLREQVGIGRKVLRHTKYVPGAILVDGEPARSDDVAHAGQTLSVAVSDEHVAVTPSAVKPEPGPLTVVYEDDDVVVLDKPADLVVHPRVGHTSGTLANYLAYHLEQTGATCKIHPVHRLDQGTTGLVAFAKSGYAQGQLQRQLHHAFHRTYLAIVKGWFDEDLGDAWHTIDAPIGRRPECVSTTFAVLPGGKRSVTHYQVLSRFEVAGEPCSLVCLKLETGRTHQIRVHMAHLGHPLIGDALYGEASEVLDRPALHAWRLAFRQPVTDEPVVLAVTLPDDLAALLADVDTHSGKGDKPRLRYHHYLCLPRFVGEGYSGAFCENMAATKRMLEERGLLVDGVFRREGIEWVDACDDVCAACPNRLGPVCVSELKVRRYDHQVEQLLASGVEPTPAMVCADCQWYELCRTL